MCEEKENKWLEYFNANIKNNELLNRFLFPILVYIITVLLVSILFYSGYRLWFLNRIPDQNVIVFQIEQNQQLANTNENIYVTKEQWQQLTSVLDKVSNNEEYKYNDQINVEILNGFYSSLFAAIAIIIALLGVFGWKSMTETRIKINKFNEIEDKVALLHKRRDFAKWAQEKFSSEDIEYSYELSLSKEDKTKFIEMENFLTDEHEENAWMELLIAHEHIFQKDNIDEAENIYKFIESRNIFPDNSKVEPLLYHLLGQLYKKKYDYNKYKNESTKIKEDMLLKSVRYYFKSIDVRKEKDRQRTRSNLAVVYIELGKQELRQFYETWGQNYYDKAIDYFKQAQEQLIKAERQGPDYNIFWDLARVVFYLNEDNNSEKIKSLLMKAAVNIPSSAKETFIDKLNQELDEFNDCGQNGFPGDKDTINEIKDRLRII